MIDKVSSWASGLIVSVIIGTIIEMLLPDNKNKKYVKVVIGLFIIYTIIAPVIGSLDDFTLDINDLLAEYTNNDSIEASASVDFSLENTYKQNIETDIVSKLNKMGYNVKKINTQINFEEGNYGMLNSISLKLEPNNYTINNIEQVEINVAIKNEQIEYDESNEEIEEIKIYLNENYGIGLNNIYIQLI